MGGGETGEQIRESKQRLSPGLPTFSPGQDKNPNTLRPVSFVVKETVCPRRTPLPPEQCDFKENGVRLGAGVPPKMLNKRPLGNVSI